MVGLAAVAGPASAGGPPPAASISDVTVTEGDSGTTDAIFTVTLDNASDSLAVVPYMTENGSASTPRDFQGVGSAAIFQPGETSKNITITVNGDTLDEPDEQFTVELFEPQNATIADGTGVGTITDDDAAGGGGRDNPRCWGAPETVNGLVGTPGDDVIVGTDGDDRIDGRGGDDRICARAGQDHVLAGGGNDRVRAGTGRDYVDGEGGNDNLFGNSGNDGQIQRPETRGNGGSPRFGIFGGSGSDELGGGSGNDELWGQEGNDFHGGGVGYDGCFDDQGDNRFRSCEQRLVIE